jgi:hypothetical protein
VYLPGWFDYWSGQDRSFQTKQQALSTLRYYVRVDGKVDLSIITETVSNHNPDNVNRVIRLMPNARFESRFPNSTNMATKNGFVPGKMYN